MLGMTLLLNGLADVGERERPFVIQKLDSEAGKRSARISACSHTHSPPLRKSKQGSQEMLRVNGTTCVLSPDEAICSVSLPLSFSRLGCALWNDRLLCQ